MPRFHGSYPEEFRRRMVELVRSGRTPEELSREFEPSAQSIHNWVRRSDLDEGRRNDGMTSAESEELAHLGLENRRLKRGRRFWQKPRPGLLGRPARYPRSLRVR